MITWVAGSLTFLGLYLAGRKTAWAWVVALLGQVLWLIFAIRLRDSGLLVMNLGFAVMYAYNLFRWKGFQMFILLKPFMPKWLFDTAPQTSPTIAPKPRPIMRGEVKECDICGSLFIPGGEYGVEQRIKLYLPNGERKTGVYNTMWYCKMHRPAYDAIEFTYVGNGGVNFYGKDSLGDEHQVTEDGEFLD